MSTYHRRVRSGWGIRAGVSGVFAAATAIGLLAVPVPAQAAPACTDYQFNGRFQLRQSNDSSVSFDSTGQTASGRAHAVLAGPALKIDSGDVGGTIQGRHLDFTIIWKTGPIGHYTGDVDDAGFAHGSTVDVTDTSSTATWDSQIPLACVPPPAAPPPPAPPSQPAPLPQAPKKPPVPWPDPAPAALGATVSGPASLQAGLSGTYVVTVTNTGGVGVPVELFITFAKNLEQTGQIRAPGFDCEVRHDAGINAAVRCTDPDLEPGAKYDIVVQGIGRAPGPGVLLASIGNNHNQKDVTIT